MSLRSLSSVVGLGCLAGVWLAPGQAEAAPQTTGQRLEWQWRRFPGWQYATTGALGATALYLSFATENPEEPKWRGPVWFDATIERSWTLDSARAREGASLISDYLGFGTQLWAYVDSALVPVIADRGNFDVAWQMTLISLQASAITGVVTRGIDRLAVRRRPDVAACSLDPEYHEMCFQGPNSAFPSGHTSGAFVGAGLVCAHHLNLPLYGIRGADVAACAVATGMATATGVLRVMAHRHYVTDVIAGAAAGALPGFALPMLGHYLWLDVDHGGVSSWWSVMPLATGDTWGASLVGTL